MIDKNEALFVVRLTLRVGKKTVPYNELALLIGEAKTPGFDRETASDADREDMVCRWIDMERPLLDAVRAGELEVLNPFTLRRLKPPFTGRLFDSSEVTVRALREYVESIHGCLELEDAPESQGAPAMAECASGSVQPTSNSPWWQTVYDIHDMAQNIGAKFQSEQKRASNAAIAKEIEKRINDIERSKARDRRSPNWDTIRGVLTGWTWRPE